MTQQVAIAGAGIIGLAAALELADAGFRVTVLEQGRAMEESSWAAAGMLAVDDPENPPGLLALSEWSRALYPSFLKRIERLSGLSVPLRTTRTLQGVHASRPMESPPGSLPALVTDTYSFHELEEASLDPRDLCAALPRAVRATGILVREGEAVRSVRRIGEKLALELASGEALAADQFLLTGGAWSALIGLPGKNTPPIAPRKGQMIEVTLDRPVLPVAVRTPELYLVPRGDGRVVIGATVEYAGFDRAVDKQAGDCLWSEAAKLWPPILQGRITARWIGLRPGFREGLADTLPILGQLEPGIWVAAGHFRNGILLAPATARALRELLLGQSSSIGLEAFSPARFTPTPAAIR